MESTFQPVSEQSHLRGKPAALATIDRRPPPPEHVWSNVAHKAAAAEIRRPKAETCSGKTEGSKMHTETRK